MNKEGFNSYFLKHFILKPGEHLLVFGITGSGKTQILIYLVSLLITKAKETIVWFDMGKSTESFFIPAWLEKRGIKTKLIIPEGCTIKNLGVNVEIDTFKEVIEIWPKIEKDKFNIVSIDPFIIHPGIYSKVISSLFDDLIRKAHNYYFLETKGIEKMALIFDEFHKIAPGQGHLLSNDQNQTGALIQMNIEKLRAFNIRFIASSQGETKIRKGVRIAFNWRIYKRISEALVDITRLKKFQEKIQALEVNQALVVLPTKQFEILELEEIFYPKWAHNIQYRGIYELIKEDKSKTYKQQIISLENFLRSEGYTQKQIAKVRGVHCETVGRDLR